MSRAYRALVLGATCLAFVVVVVGAYVRLMDAGLGCPDWPGCYGELSPSHARDAIEKAVEAQGGEHGPVSLRKAWKEMLHRYLAGTLGLAIAAIAVASWRKRVRSLQSPALPTALVALVMLQAALGMWTVTLLLKPVIVSLHLLGGMATFALLVWLSSRQLDIRAARANDLAIVRSRPSVRVALVVLVLQIALGAWVSSNYAALACVDFPTCHGTWAPDMDFRHGFQFVRELGRTAAGDHLAYAALTAIHWTHRLGALITLVYVGLVAFLLTRTPETRPFGALVGVLLIVQIGLGVANVLAGLPLAIAVAHNAVAALLLASLVVINFAVSRTPRSPPH
jgi:cytochrome c oxidase assembly protein subunit 15